MLTGTLEARNLLGFIDVTLGRQIEMELMDLIALDGLRVRIQPQWYLFLESYIGLQVVGPHPLSTTVYEKDGVTEPRLRDVWSPVWDRARL